jgi:anti-anti-sigma regulatory factor
MALFSKPPAKKAEPKPATKGAAGSSARGPVSARDVADQVQALGRRSEQQRPRTEPGDISLSGNSLIDWSPGRMSIEVAQANPGLCAVLENAALLYASGQAQAARTILEQGVQTDHDAKVSPLAWLALFDLLQRARDRATFDQFALQYVVQFERSAPSWEGDEKVTPAKALSGGGYVMLSGKLVAASAPQFDPLRRALNRGVTQVRLDLATATGFDDAGARLLANAIADVRKRKLPLTLQRADKLRVAVEAQVKRGRDGGEGAWLLALEMLQVEHRQQAFEDRAIEYAIAFEQSPPSWEPPPAAAETPIAVDAKDAASFDDGVGERRIGAGTDMVVWNGVLTGNALAQMAQVAEFAQTRPVVPIDMTAVDRIDFVCAGSLLNAINRVESQRRAVQIVGATPIVRAMLLLIGISPRHFVKKAL